VQITTPNRQIRRSLTHMCLPAVMTVPRNPAEL
jgi:hypothetical protein